MTAATRWAEDHACTYVWRGREMLGQVTPALVGWLADIIGPERQLHRVGWFFSRRKAEAALEGALGTNRDARGAPAGESHVVTDTEEGTK